MEGVEALLGVVGASPLTLGSFFTLLVVAFVKGWIMPMSTVSDIRKQAADQIAVYEARDQEMQARIQTKQETIITLTEATKTLGNQVNELLEHSRTTAMFMKSFAIAHRMDLDDQNQSTPVSGGS